MKSILIPVMAVLDDKNPDNIRLWKPCARSECDEPSGALGLHTSSNGIPMMLSLPDTISSFAASHVPKLGTIQNAIFDWLMNGQNAVVAVMASTALVLTVCLWLIFRRMRRDLLRPLKKSNRPPMAADHNLFDAALNIANEAIDDQAAERRAAISMDILQGMRTAIAAFGSDRRLELYNRACADLWKLPQNWLDARPKLDDILERLRENRCLPEQRDFAAWKREQLCAFDATKVQTEEFWHLLGGQSLRVASQPRRAGGFVLHFEDVSERLQLLSSCNTQSAVQRATLDALNDGIAVFGCDGKLKLHNKAFRRQWSFTENELSHGPHLKRISDMHAARCGRDEIWPIIADCVTSDAPNRANEWDEVKRADGRFFSFTLTRLPDSAILVTFADMTDHVRLREALLETRPTAAKR